MPNNFKITGANVYVSKAGNDANSGLTPDAPKLTVQAGLNVLAGISNSTLVIGSGVYRETISGGFAINLSSHTIIGDGEVIFEGLNYLNCSFFHSATGGQTTVNIYNIKFRNYSNLTFNSSQSDGRAAFILNVYDSSFINNARCFIIGPTTFFASASTCFYSFYNCLILNSPWDSLSLRTDHQIRVSYRQCSFINSCVIKNHRSFENAAITSFLNCYTDSKSTVEFRASLGSSMNFNNLQGKIIVDADGSVSGANSNGIALSFAQHRIDYPTYNVNSFSSDPLFNNPTFLDYTLQQGSPNISASSDFSSNIGGTEYAVSYIVSSSAFTSAATSQSLDYRGLYYGISGSAVSGSITSGPMFLQWPRVKPLTSVNWIGSLDFNKTITASFAGNTNVPAYTTYTSASLLAGANPDRLKIALRFSTQQTQPSTEAEWDNNGYWAPGTYQLFEINQKPTIDYKGTGNGDASFAGNSGLGDLVPSWIQTEIILRNDYNL